MASKVKNITSYVCNIKDGILEYKFNLGSYTFEFDIVEFYSIKEYCDYLENDKENIFRPLEKYSDEIHLIAGYDWNVINSFGDELNIFDLVRSVEWIGKEYVLANWPDVIFYEAEDRRLHRIYERMFPSFGYNLTYSIDNNYIYTKFGRDRIKIIQEEV